jgi:hypothetical protein
MSMTSGCPVRAGYGESVTSVVTTVNAVDTCLVAAWVWLGPVAP